MSGLDTIVSSDLPPSLVGESDRRAGGSSADKIQRPFFLQVAKYAKKHGLSVPEVLKRWDETIYTVRPDGKVFRRYRGEVTEVPQDPNL